jgi:hypothetical protein
MTIACAARGDALAVLSLPFAYEGAQIERHVDVLARDVRTATAWNEAEATRALASAAIYHPWTRNADLPQAAGATPPCGAIAGMLASVAERREAWRAITARPLRRVTTLEGQRLAASPANVNLLETASNGVRTRSEYTLAMPIRVGARRLVHQLLRVAAWLGREFVFEAADDRLLRMIRLRFGGLLRELFVHGALAGERPEQAFALTAAIAGHDSNAIVTDISVAPSVPLEFVTIRLVRDAERSHAEVVRG